MPALLLCSLLLGACSYPQFTPEQLLTDFVLDGKPATSVHDLHGKYIARHEWTAWLRFFAGNEDRMNILKELDALEVDRSQFKAVAGYFDEAPPDLRPPKDWLGKCQIYEGTNSKGITSYLIINNATGETFISLQQI